MTTEIADIEQQKAIDHIRELLTAHWREAEDAQDEDGKFGIGLRISVENGAPVKLKGACRISRTITDEMRSESMSERRDAAANTASARARKPARSASSCP